jgi:hypothetical protein
MRRLEGEWVGEGQGRGRVEAVWEGSRWLHECGQWHAFIQDDEAKENKRERKRVRATMRVGLSVRKRWER